VQQSRCLGQDEWLGAYWHILASLAHHAEGRVDPDDLAKKNPSTNFFQKLIQIHKMWLKLAKIG
jgi:hypothetical protein